MDENQAKSQQKLANEIQTALERATALSTMEVIGVLELVKAGLTTKMTLMQIERQAPRPSAPTIITPPGRSN
jgi:hypothetical protein